MDRSAGQAIARRLIVACAVFVLGLLVCPSNAVAQTYSDALAACQAYIANDFQSAFGWTGFWDAPVCQDATTPGGVSAVELYATPSASGVANAKGPVTQYFTYTGSAPPSNPCTGLPPVTVTTTFTPGVTHFSNQGQTAEKDSTGATVFCAWTATYSSPTAVADAYGHYWITETMTYSGVPAGGGDSTASVGTPQFDDASGNPVSPQPAVSSSAAPTECGGGSCYDPNTGNYCAVGAAGQVCVSGSQAATASGGCASSGAATMCAGSPSSPSPVGQSGSQISDPGTQIQSSDTYSTANPATGAVSKTTVNVFSSGGATSSGATSSSLPATKGASSSTVSGQSSNPASSSSSGNGDAFNGGTDCNTPPACQGDAVLCGVAQEQWRTLCSVQTQTKGMMGDPTQQPPTFAQDSTRYGQGDVWQQPSTGNTVGDAANAGNYDESGFGFSTQCPFEDKTIELAAGGSFVIPFSFGCNLNPALYWLVVGTALVIAAVITAGGRG